MSDAFYAEMADIALDIIDEFQQGVLMLERRTLVAGAEPWDPSVPTTQQFPVVGTVQAVDRRLVDGTTVIATDRMAIIPTNSLPVNVRPEMSDRLVIDGEPAVIKKILTVPAAGIAIVYKLVLGS
jgi:hypothetical protein